MEDGRSGFGWGFSGSSLCIFNRVVGRKLEGTASAFQPVLLQRNGRVCACEVTWKELLQTVQQEMCDGSCCGSAGGQGERVARQPSLDAAGLRAVSVRFNISHGSCCFIFTQGERSYWNKKKSGVCFCYVAV